MHDAARLPAKFNRAPPQARSRRKRPAPARPPMGTMLPLRCHSVTGFALAHARNVTVADANGARP